MYEEKRKAYPTDLSDEEWAQIEKLLTPTAPSGRKSSVEKREIINALLYLGHTPRCSWRMMPHDLPAWRTVYYYYNRWQKDGTLDRLRIALQHRSKGKRVRLGVATKFANRSARREKTQKTNL